MAGHAGGAVQPAPRPPGPVRLLGREGQTRRTRDGLLAPPLARTWSPTSRPTWCAPGADARPPRTVASRVRSRRVDVAVLVPTRVTAEHVRDALAAAGCRRCSPARPASSARRRRADWVTLLQGLDQPRQAMVRRAALTAWSAGRPGLAAGRRAARGRPLGDVPCAGPGAGRPRRGGPVRAVGTDTDLAARVLGRTDGERVLTDLRHVGQVLHAAMTAPARPSAACSAGCARRRRAPSPTTHRGRGRLDTDAAAVQIPTVHRSKGLEFPVVYLPVAWDLFGAEPRARRLPAAARPHRHARCSTSAAGGRGRVRALPPSAPTRPGEDLRLLYVGTDPGLVAGGDLVGPPAQHAASPLHRLLGRRPGAATRSRATGPCGPTQARCASAPTARRRPRAGGRASDERQPAAHRAVGRQGGDGSRWPRAGSGGRWTTAWRRTSYSGLTAPRTERLGRRGHQRARAGEEDDECRRSPTPGLLPPPTPDAVAAATPGARAACRRWRDLERRRTSAPRCTPCSRCVDPGRRPAGRSPSPPPPRRCPPAAR